MVMYMQLLKLDKQEKKRNRIEALRFFCFVELILISVMIGSSQSVDAAETGSALAAGAKTVTVKYQNL